MKVSGFTFIRNGTSLGYPFIESIKSILPICDEFIIALGKSEDNTLSKIRALKSKKIKIKVDDDSKHDTEIKLELITKNFDWSKFKIKLDTIIDKIRLEKSYWKEIKNIRYGLGGCRNIHKPETEINPPTPFFYFVVFIDV